MSSRRTFIENLALGTAAMALFPQLSFAGSGKRKLKKIGFISNMLKNELKEGDWRQLLLKTVQMGYSEYEGGVQGDSAKVFLNHCRSIGLKPVAGKVSKTENMDIIQQDFDILNELGMKYAVNYYPWFSKAPFKPDDCKRSADWLNRVGEKAKKNGLVFCWHNHDKEFWEMDGELPFDYLMRHTDKNTVFCEMDIYWVQKGGSDPLSVLKQYPGRIPILHVKDMAGDNEQTFECAGSGIIDFPSVFAEAESQGIQHYFVERDNVTDGLGCLKSSSDYLLNLRF